MSYLLDSSPCRFRTNRRRIPRYAYPPYTWNIIRIYRYMQLPHFYILGNPINARPSTLTTIPLTHLLTVYNAPAIGFHVRRLKNSVNMCMQGQPNLLLQHPRHVLLLFVTYLIQLTQNPLFSQSTSPGHCEERSMSSRSSRARCKYIGASSSRCGALVSLVNAIHFPRGGRIPAYCAFHQQVALSTKSFDIHRRNGTRMMPFKRSRRCSCFIRACL